MDIKELLGEAYKDGMTIEEINAVLAEKNLVDANTLPKSVSKDLFDKKVSELAKKSKELEEFKQLHMSEEEKNKLLIDEANCIKSDYLKKSAKLDVEQILIQNNLKPSEYESVLDSLVTEDAEESKSRANALVDLVNLHTQQVKEDFKKELRNSLPNQPTGNQGDDATKNDFDKMTLTQKMEFKEKYPEEYENLNGGN